MSKSKSHCEASWFSILIKASAGGGGKGMRVVKAKLISISKWIAISENIAALERFSFIKEKSVWVHQHIKFKLLDSH
jgi:acetyl/propionyl-CoA carboxylase alpha subunit